MTLNFTIEGCPRTKKNHGRRVWARKQRRVVHLPSEAHEAWAEAAVAQLVSQRVRRRYETITGPCILRALVYREKDHGDLIGFLEAICDALQKAEIVVNDKLVHGFDYSRPLVDRARPRVEITLTPL